VFNGFNDSHLSSIILSRMKVANPGSLDKPVDIRKYPSTFKNMEELTVSKHGICIIISSHM
jgi:hypothetical protein